MAVTSDVKLRVYNRALRALGARKLVSVSDDVETRHVLEDIWGGSDETVDEVLEKADWNFAMRSVESAYDPSASSNWGFSYVHAKPSDFIRMSGIAVDPYFRQPLTRMDYGEESGRFLTNHPELYLRYVSNGDAYGLDSSLWPESFKAYLAAHLAYEAAERLTGDRSKKEDASAAMAYALKEAKSHDAMNEGVKFPPAGSWVRSRAGGFRRNSRWDGTTR